MRWRDVLEVHDREESEIKDEDDIERVSPSVETVGRICAVKRGTLAIEPEWHLMKDHEEYAGFTGETIQIMPVGCIEAIYELKIGKKLYKNPLFEEEKKDASRPSGDDPGDGNRGSS